MENELTLSLGKKNHDRMNQKDEITKPISINRPITEEIEKTITLNEQQKDVKGILEKKDNKISKEDVFKNQINMKNDENFNIIIKRSQTNESFFGNTRQHKFDKDKNNFDNNNINKSEQINININSNYKINRNEILKTDQNKKIIKDLNFEGVKIPLRPKTSSKYKKLPMDSLIKSQSSKLSISKFAALIALRNQKLIIENPNFGNLLTKQKIRPVSAYYVKKNKARRNLNSKDINDQHDIHDISDDLINNEDDSETLKQKNPVKHRANLNSLEDAKFSRLKHFRIDRPRSAISSYNTNTAFQDERIILKNMDSGNSVRLGEIIKNGSAVALSVKKIQEHDSIMISPREQITFLINGSEKKNNSMSLEYYKSKNSSNLIKSNGIRALTTPDEPEKEMIPINSINIDYNRKKLYLKFSMTF